MDSTSTEQDPTAGNSPEGVQEDTGSRVDPSPDRINGLMRLVGKRTTEVSAQKVRADKAEAALAALQERLATYEGGATMSDADAAEVEQTTDVEEESGEALADGQDFWLPGLPGSHSPTWEPAHTYVDPSSVSRVQSFSPRSTPTERLKTEFDSVLDSAIDDWGWKGTD
jgi:hypothetical protein